MEVMTNTRPRNRGKRASCMSPFLLVYVSWRIYLGFAEPVAFSDCSCHRHHIHSKMKAIRVSFSGFFTGISWLLIILSFFSVSIAPHVDPSTLCPYCDTPLPSTPSPLLLKMLATTKKKSQRDPRPSNPLGLRAPLAAFIAACQRHRFESQILPEAERKGWPKTIEWNRVGARIIKMKAHLKALIEDPAADNESEQEQDPNDWDVLYASNKSKRNGPRRGKAGSIFWMEIIEEVKQKGLRAVSGVRGQFATFEKAQPG